MSELRKPLGHRLKARLDEPLIVVPVGDHDVQYFTDDDELERAIEQSSIQEGLDLAGAWSDLGISEEEMLRALGEIRHESEPTPSIDPA